MVVDVDEGVDLGLQFGQGRCSGLAGEPAFEGLLEADLAAGGRMVRGGVDLPPASRVVSPSEQSAPDRTDVSLRCGRRATEIAGCFLACPASVGAEAYRGSGHRGAVTDSGVRFLNDR